MRSHLSSITPYSRDGATSSVPAVVAFPHAGCSRPLPRPTAIAVILAVALALSGCATLRGRADDALAHRDYRSAAELYAQVLAKNPNDASARLQLTRAERGWFDETFATFDGEQRGDRKDAALRAALSVLEVKDHLADSSLDDARRGRLEAMLVWTEAELRDAIHAETTRDRALAARARRKTLAPWLDRPELAAMKPALDQEIVDAAARTCASATKTAADAPFALELVAAYCKEWGAPLPPWKARPLLVGGVRVAGTIAGTPVEENVQLRSVIATGFERSVWFSPTASSVTAAVAIEGAVSATFTTQRVELSRGWTESVPYESTETYSVPVEVPFTATETYDEQVPYEAHEDRSEPCRPPKEGMCTVSRPVTRMRTVTRSREVTRTRTVWEERTRPVTLYRNEPRVFRYRAQKHEGTYHASAYVELTLPEVSGAVVVRDIRDDRQSAYEHDVVFAPAGISPEHANLPSALAWREDQRVGLARRLTTSLDAKWVTSFCGAGVSSIEEAARCVHARPTSTPPAVRSQLGALFTDDLDLVLALPRPKEG